MPSHVDFTADKLNDARFIQNRFGNESLIGTFEDRQVVFPDFSNPDTSDWFKGHLESVLASVATKPVGISLVRNSPFAKLSETCEPDSEEFPFLPNSVVNETIFGIGTICPEARQTGGSHFRFHNNYARDHVQQLKTSLGQLGAEAYVFSKHSSPRGTEGVTGSDRPGSWSNLGASLREVLELSISGAGFVSMQACGVEPKVMHLNDTYPNEELCLRWYQLAAYMPALHSFHDSLGHNETLPHGFSQKNYVRWVKRALQRRIRLAPYMYTQMYLSSRSDTEESGLPLVRPLFVEFSDDWFLLNNFFGIWKQFMFGQSILVNPIVESGIRVLEAYFPRAIWYELWSGLRFEGHSQTVKTEVIQAQIPAYLR